MKSEKFVNTREAITIQMRKFLKPFDAGRIRRFLTQPLDLNAFGKKPSKRFMAGLVLVVLSYLMAWPFIIALGIISTSFSRPWIILVGSPIAYVSSYFLFAFGIFVAGEDSIQYIGTLRRWIIKRSSRLFAWRSQGTR